MFLVARNVTTVSLVNRLQAQIALKPISSVSDFGKKKIELILWITINSIFKSHSELFNTFYINKAFIKTAVNKVEILIWSEIILVQG